MSEVTPQTSEEKKVVIVACAGTDKALGSVTREVAFKVNELRPKDTIIVSIPPLAAQVNTTIELVKKYPTIIIDGCAERCATKIAAKNQVKIREKIFLPQCTKKYNLMPDTAYDIGVAGKDLAQKVAQEVVALVDKVLRKGN